MKKKEKRLSSIEKSFIQSPVVSHLQTVLMQELVVLVVAILQVRVVVTHQVLAAGTRQVPVEADMEDTGVVIILLKKMNPQP